MLVKIASGLSVIVFRQWSRKAFAVMSSLGNQIKIAKLNYDFFSSIQLCLNNLNRKDLFERIDQYNQLLILNFIPNFSKGSKAILQFYNINTKLVSI
ncbi:MAG: hypothetical protein JXR60_04775 [Bacteroidales bacterium]|nr:hypothetical protein [Bacteroidales bacterium]